MTSRGTIPLIEADVGIAGLAGACLGWMRGSDGAGRASRMLSDYIGLKHCFLLSSGTAAFYCILKAISRMRGRKEVILPAYTAGSLLLPIKKLGLTAVLADISEKDFNISVSSVKKAIGPETLCVLGVHAFGMPCDVNGLREASGNAGGFFVEDCAQSLGSLMDGRKTGSFGDASFFSFGRGKNLSTYCGGAVLTGSGEISDQLGQEIRMLPSEGLVGQLTAGLLMAAISAVEDPYVYRAAYGILDACKMKEVPKGFRLARYGGLQAAALAGILHKLDGKCAEKDKKGRAMMRSLAGIPGVIVPEAGEGARVAFPRFPVAVRDAERIPVLRKKLLEAGVDSAVIYPRTLDEIMPGVCEVRGSIDCARYLAPRILTLPAGKYLQPGDVETIRRVFAG